MNGKIAFSPLVIGAIGATHRVYFCRPLRPKAFSLPPAPFTARNFRKRPSCIKTPFSFEKPRRPLKPLLPTVSGFGTLFLVTRVWHFLGANQPIFENLTNPFVKPCYFFFAAKRLNPSRPHIFCYPNSLINVKQHFLQLGPRVKFFDVPFVIRPERPVSQLISRHEAIYVLKRQIGKKVEYLNDVLIVELHFLIIRAKSASLR